MGTSCNLLKGLESEKVELTIDSSVACGETEERVEGSSRWPDNVKSDRYLDRQKYRQLRNSQDNDFLACLLSVCCSAIQLIMGNGDPVTKEHSTRN